jgi:hypothetical protein
LEQWITRGLFANTIVSSVPNTRSERLAQILNKNKQKLEQGCVGILLLLLLNENENSWHFGR